MKLTKKQFVLALILMLLWAGTIICIQRSWASEGRIQHVEQRQSRPRTECPVHRAGILMTFDEWPSSRLLPDEEAVDPSKNVEFRSGPGHKGDSVPPVCTCLTNETDPLIAIITASDPASLWGSSAEKLGFYPVHVGENIAVGIAPCAAVETLDRAIKSGSHAARLERYASVPNPNGGTTLGFHTNANAVIVDIRSSGQMSTKYADVIVATDSHSLALRVFKSDFLYVLNKKSEADFLVIFRNWSAPPE